MIALGAIVARPRIALAAEATCPSARGQRRAGMRRGVMFQPGDYVYPTDLPLRLLCRITHVESLNPGGEGFQVLKLTPLAGPWNARAQLVRFSEGVRPAPGLAACADSPAPRRMNRRSAGGRRWMFSW